MNNLDDETCRLTPVPDRHQTPLQHYKHVYRHVCRHVCRHVYRRVCRRVYRHAYRHACSHPVEMWPHGTIGRLSLTYSQNNYRHTSTLALDMPSAMADALDMPSAMADALDMPSAMADATSMLYYIAPLDQARSDRAQPPRRLPSACSEASVKKNVLEASARLTRSESTRRAMAS